MITGIAKTPAQQHLHGLWSIGRFYALRQYRWYLAGIVSLILTNIIMLEIPQLASSIVNTLSPQNGISPNWSVQSSQLIPVAWSIVGLGLLVIVIRTLSRVFIFWPGRTLEASVKDDVFQHLLLIPLKKLTAFGLGDVTSRLSNDITQLRVFYAFGVLQVLNVVFMSSFTIAKMFSLSSSLTALTVAPLIFMLIITRFAMPKLYVATRASTVATGKLTNRVTEAFAHVSVIQSSVSESSFLDRSDIEAREIYDANIQTVWIRNFIFPMMIIMSGLGELAILAWGGSQVLSGTLTIGDLMAFNIYIGILVFPFTSIGLILAIYQRAKPASERLVEVALVPTETQLLKPQFQGYANLSAPDAKPQLLLHQFSFQFDSSKTILNNLNAEVHSGKKVGIYGPIGSGKTTLFNILTKIYGPAPGQIFWQGTDLTQLNPEEIRSQIAYAPQSPLLLSDSIKSNLELGFPNGLTDDLIIEALTKAAIWDEIAKFPEGIHTIVGENGVRLSGGQKQRVSLARIFLRQPHMFILDDVLSAVDHTTEKILIENLMQTKATLMIASHRPSILESCDEVWILNHGSIANRGTFDAMKPIFSEKLPTEETTSL
jgi:ATP-binding cassette, subfamily B, multidrug efflux pump